MKLKEAKILLDKGEAITHRLFDDNEYIIKEDGVLFDELGYKLDEYEFWGLRFQKIWEDGWNTYYND